MSTVVSRDIFNDHNPYGFIFNVNVSPIDELYKRYKVKRKLPEHYPISDNERRRFDWYIQQLINGGYLIVK